MEDGEEITAMFWLRCNKCYRLMRKSGKTFSMTQCQHLFCSTCIVGADKICPECKAQGSTIVTLAKPMQQPLSHYFENLGNLLQKILEAAIFQRIQISITLRRYSEIQWKYEQMKKTYYQAGEQMKSLMGAHAKLKEKHANIVSDIARLQSNPSPSYNQRVRDMTNPNFMCELTHRRPQQSPHMMDYVTGSSRSRSNGSRDNSGPSSLNSSRSSIIAIQELPNWQGVSSVSTSRSSIAPPFPEHHKTQQQHISQSIYHNRPTTESSQYRYSSNGQGMLLGYAPHVVASHVVTPMIDTRHLNAGWTAPSRMLGSAGISTNYSSTGGTLRHNTPMVIDNYSNYL